MISMENKTLRSARLEYRILNEEDKTALRAILANGSVTAPAGFMPAKSNDEFEAFFTSLTVHKTAIAILREGTLIGYVRVNRYVSDDAQYEGKNCVSTGFVIGSTYQKQGYGTEMLAFITKYLKTLFDFCFADCFEGNEASRTVIERCGYKFTEKYTMFFEELNEEKTCLSYVY